MPRIATTSKFSEPRLHLHARLVSLTLRFVLSYLTIRLGHSCSPFPFSVVARVPLFSHLSFVSLTLSISLALSCARTCFTFISSLSPFCDTLQYDQYYTIDVLEPSVTSWFIIISPVLSPSSSRA